jgi:hypothetical protein
MSGEDAEQELRSLYSWLRDEPDVRRHAQLSVVAGRPRPGDMGAALEVIKLVTDSGFQLLNLALAYAAWRGTRTAAPKITIERDNATITLSDVAADDVAKIIRSLESGQP